MELLPLKGDRDNLAQVSTGDRGTNDGEKVVWTELKLLDNRLG